jgi:oligoribonuclease
MERASPAEWDGMKHFFWVDLEMTGLDDLADRILEVAVVVTDLELRPVKEYHRVVYQPPEVLENMNDWCKKTHGESGLTAAVPGGTPLGTVERELIALAGEFWPPRERIVLCGNSVGNDKRFIDRHLPEFAKLLHYRLIDVSSFKEVFREMYKVGFAKANAHRAVDDVHESIRELKHYLGFVKVPGAPGGGA